jgi:hypothetical protein
MPVESTSGFMAWIQQYGQIILFFAQIFFWLAVSVAALWATMLFKRLVDARTPSKDAAVASEPAEKPAVDEFVD